MMAIPSIEFSRVELSIGLLQKVLVLRLAAVLAGFVAGLAGFVAGLAGFVAGLAGFAAGLAGFAAGLAGFAAGCAARLCLAVKSIKSLGFALGSGFAQCL